MDLNHLRYFAAIAEHGSMSAAARVLRVSQPTLTVAIQNLEERLKTTLFLRDSRGVSLTSSGRVLSRAAAEVFALLERTEQEILGLEEGDVGEFILGCHESLGAYFLPNFMRELVAAAPKIQLSLWNASSSAVREAVIDRSVHFGLSVNPAPHPDLVMVELFHDGIELCVSKKEPPVRTRAEAHERIKRGPLIYAGRVTQCQDIIARLNAEGVMPERNLSCGDLELVKSLALAGLGVALLPRRVAAYGHEGELVRLHKELPGYPDTIYLLFRGDLHRTRAALKLKDAVVAYGRSLRESDPNEDSIMPP